MAKKGKINKIFKNTWHFIWEDDSIWSWLVNIVLAFVLIKFIVYPGLGFVLSTTHPIVAVVSSSMEHDRSFDEWWDINKQWYIEMDLSNEYFSKSPFKNGFNKGDIMILKGEKPQDIKIGEVIVFQSKRPDPIIHRVVKKWKEEGTYYFQTKGDNNQDSFSSPFLDETRISEDKLVGKAICRVPLLGYIKIWFVQLIGLFQR